MLKGFFFPLSLPHHAGGACFETILNFRVAASS
jgi:hypothetical protein